MKMKRNEILSYTLDFVRLLVDKLRYDVEIILFGSVVSGRLDRKSDVDLFIHTKKHINEIKKIVREAIEEFEVYSRDTWQLRGIELPIKCIVSDLNFKRWSPLKREIISNGITLYGKYREIPKGLKHYMIFSFQLTGKPKQKVKSIRQLYGYTSRKGKKVYSHKGLLQEVDGFKLNPSTIVVPIENQKEIYNFLTKNKIKFEVREIWF